MTDFSKYIISDEATIREALIALEHLSNDVLTLFVVSKKKLVGTITDGDIRRALIRNIALDTSVVEIMNSHFTSIAPKENDIKKINAIRNKGIELLPCIDEMGELVRIYNLRKKKSLLPIDAVLMAGGKGERLRPLTEKTPKPLLKVGSKAIIDYNVENLISYGVEDIHVTVNYLAEQLHEHFFEKIENCKINCVQEDEFLGTIASVKLIPNIKNDDVLIMNSDLFTNIDFEDFYCHFKEKDADMSVAAIPYSVNIPYGIFELEGRDVKGIKEKPTYNYYANAGIYLIKKELLEVIPLNTFFDATDFMSLLISQNKRVTRYPLVGYWIDIGKPEDYQKAQDFVKHIVR
ncbi:MAG: nucleotidyltransferase family protein [Filimonas sp.]|nr:nucleotidyltransferase family protein [Filimonas sp.]